MRDLLHQIEAGLDANLYYLSLYVSLTIPDICGALNSDNGHATADKYKEWFNKYVACKYNSAWLLEKSLEAVPESIQESVREEHKPEQLFSAEDCYRFRCSLLHQGTSQHSKGTHKQILFVEPGATTSTFHLNRFGDVLNIDVPIFCNDIVDSAEQWLNEVETTERYRRNYNRVMRRYPNGLSPYIVGVPVIG